MKRIPHQHILATLVAPLLLSGSLLQGATYFSENFDTTTTAGLTNAGWDINHNATATEVGSDFVLATFPYGATDYTNTVWPPGIGGAPGTSFNNLSTGAALVTPPGADGNASSVSSGGYLISDSDSADNSDDIGSLSEFWAITPSFSTVGANQVWWHADADIDANNNGECLVTLDVSVDGGATWTQAWAQAEPQRPIKSYNFSLTDPAFEGGTPIGGYPVLGSYSQTKTWDGIHGRWHVQLPAIANNKANVKVRIRYIEPADAWWIALDNVLVDNNPPPQGNQVVLSESFANGIPGTWNNLSTPQSFQKWSTGPLTNSDGTLQMTLSPGGAEVNVDLLANLEMARLAGLIIAPTAVNNWAVSNFVDFVDQTGYHPDAPIDGYFLTMMAGGKYAMWQAGSNYSLCNLDTPALNLSDKSEVFLDFDSEWLQRQYNSANPTTNSQVFLAQVSVDGGTTFSNVFNYQGALGNIGEAAYFMHHYIPVPQAAGKSSVVFRFRAEGRDNGNLSDVDNPDSGTRHQGFWVIDNVRVTANAPVSAPTITSIVTQGTDVVITWTGGTGPFLVQGTGALGSTWVDLQTTSSRTARIPRALPVMFLRIQDGTTKTVALFKSVLNGANERPNPVTTPGNGIGLLALDGTTASYWVTYSGLTAVASAAHVHGPADATTSAGVMFGVNPVGAFGTAGVIAGTATITATQAGQITAGNSYFNIHTSTNPGGEIRGQLLLLP